MKSIEEFVPALSCSSGVCGVLVDRGRGGGLPRPVGPAHRRGTSGLGLRRRAPCRRPGRTPGGGGAAHRHRLWRCGRRHHRRHRTQPHRRHPGTDRTAARPARSAAIARLDTRPRHRHFRRHFGPRIPYRNESSTAVARGISSATRAAKRASSPRAASRSWWYVLRSSSISRTSP